MDTPDPWLAAKEQPRSRPLSETLRLARAAAAAAGVTRLADLTGLAPFGIPVFQAVRPGARLLSVSQGKGLTPMSAKVSALLEAVEQDCAERTPLGGTLSSLSKLGQATSRIWHEAPRSPLGISVDPDLVRRWLSAENLTSSGTAFLPWDLVSLDFARSGLPDVRRSTVGLATGNTLGEACVAAVGELIEHDLQVAIASCSPKERRAVELDLDSIDDVLARSLVKHILGRGFAVRAWAMGQDAGIAAFRCVITDLEGGAMLPPAGGTACHPNRAVAFLRALLEAVQSRITLIAGARDDLDEADYQDGSKKTVGLILGALSFGRGALPWSHIPDHAGARDRERLDILLQAAQRRSPLPVLLHVHTPPVPGLCVVHAFAPGLADQARTPCEPRLEKPSAPPSVGRSARRPIVFVGPTLPRHLIPPDVDVRPPACCGDLAALLDEAPPAVGLIDGCFETAPTVWHKEVLDLIAHGIPVIGGASLGALRAAELEPFGMQGIGAIFEAYRDLRIVRDDAVMVCHAPSELGYRQLTIALVDMEAALLAAGLDPQERRQLQRIARRLDFRERSWRRCLELYRRRTGKTASLDASQLEAIGSLKQRDAQRLVNALRITQPLANGRPRPPLTSFYSAMLEKRIRSPLSAPVRTPAYALPA
jgi:YcaO-like protein with predicted kinase domain